MARPDYLVRFDWAIKRLLRNKADYVVVEGLLTCLLGKKIFIKNMLEVFLWKTSTHCSIKHK